VTGTVTTLTSNAPSKAVHEPNLALHIEDLTVAYNDKPVLWDIDIDVPPGVLAAILGPTTGRARARF
jgi:ABC-type transporter Mla maintaining outer membrane lipid asymmetry ATPase subunit MlaF